MYHSMFRLLVGLLAVLLAGCSGLGMRAKEAPPPPSAAAGEEGARAYSRQYLIGPGDSLNIVVWRNPDVSTTVPVRPDGMITIPMVEDMPASGKSTSQLARDLEKALAKFIQEPVVSVIVTSFSGPYSEQVRVIGQAARPQALPYRENMTVMDVLIAVGGLTEFAAGNRAVILRSQGIDKQQFNVRLDSLLKDGDVSANVDMRPGDVLIIPQSLF